MREPNNPLPWLAAAFVVGLCAAPGMVAGAASSEWRVWAVLAVFCGASSTVVWACLKPLGAPQFDPGDGRHWQLGLLAAGALVVGMVAPSQDGERGHTTVPLSGVARLEGVVEDSRPLAGEDTRSVLRVLTGTRLEGGAIAPGTYLSAGPVALPRGARVRVLAKLAPRVRFRNPTPHPDIPPRYETQGHAFITDASAVSVLERAVWFEWLDAARQRVRAGLDTTLPPRAAGLARALVLGDDRAVDPGDAERVRDAGLLQVLAVSGLHVAILAGLLVGLLERALLWCSRLAARIEVRRIACATGVPLVLGYAAFAGGAPSAWRAAVTAAIAWALIALGRRPDAVAVTAAAALVLGVQAPGDVVRPAFLLSIGATAAILGGRSPRPGDLRSWLRDASVLSIRSTLATAPIVVWCFGTLPLVGVLANVLLAPFGSWLLVQLSALHALACVVAGTPLSGMTGALFVVVSDAFMAACGAFAGLGPPLELPPFDVAEGVVLAASAALLLLLRAARARGTVVALASCLLCVFELRLRGRERPHDELRVTFLDVGQGDAALVDLPDGRLMLIDAGGNPGGGLDPGRAVLLPLLQARRRSRIDLAVLTHPHPDHYGGLAALIEALPITELWDSGQADAERALSSTSAEASRLLDRARAHGTRVLGPAALCGRRMPAGMARISVLGPCPAYDSGLEPNDNSLVVRIDFGAHHLLFAGDAEAAAEHALLGQPEALRATVLKVAHHGSRTSTGEAFLAAVAPRLAIISAGASNHFGHPHAEVVERLRRASIRVLSLAEVGGTIVRSDGRRLQVSTWRGDRVELPGRGTASP